MIRLSPGAAPLLLTALFLVSCEGTGWKSRSNPEDSLRYRDGSRSEAAQTGTSSGVALTFYAQEGWEREEPSAETIVAQYMLPAPTEGEDEAHLKVHRFAGGAGSMSANFTRWTGWFSQPDGRESALAAKRSKRTVRGMTVHELDVSGDYRTPGGEGQTQPGLRLLASVVESPYGDYHLELLGPSTTVAAWAASWSTFLDQIEP